MSNDQELHQAKEVEFYAATVNAWLTTRFELDKSLLTLSAGGIGLIITLVSTLGVRSVESLILSLLTMICFIITLSCVLLIFHRNAVYIQETVKTGSSSSNPVLAILDRIALFSFVAGVVLAAVIGFSTAVNSYFEKASKVTEKKVLLDQISQESIDMLMALKPSAPAQKVRESEAKAQPTPVQDAPTSTSK